MLQGSDEIKVGSAPLQIKISSSIILLVASGARSYFLQATRRLPNAIFCQVRKLLHSKRQNGQDRRRW